MGLFINKGKHPDVFKNKDEIKEPNQDFSKTDYLSELVAEQKKASDSLNDSFHELKTLLEQQRNIQANQWKEAGSRMKELKVRNFQHERHVMKWLRKLNDNNTKLQSILENESLLKQEFIDQINSVSRSNQEIVNRLEEYGSKQEQLHSQMNQQMDLQKQMAERIGKQEDHQHEVISRLDNQEALTEKILRQIDHLRSILFERSHHLAEKIEEGYNLTSSYVYKLMTGSDQPLELFIINQKQGEKQKTSD